MVNQSKGTAGIKKGYGCKWTWEITQSYTYTQIKVKEQLVLRKDSCSFTLICV
jgi:hypothetical protein